MPKEFKTLFPREMSWTWLSTSSLVPRSQGPTQEELLAEIRDLLAKA